MRRPDTGGVLKCLPACTQFPTPVPRLSDSPVGMHSLAHALLALVGAEMKQQFVCVQTLEVSRTNAWMYLIIFIDAALTMLDRAILPFTPSCF